MTEFQPLYKTMFRKRHKNSLKHLYYLVVSYGFFYSEIFSQISGKVNLKLLYFLFPKQLRN